MCPQVLIQSEFSFLTQPRTHLLRQEPRSPTGDQPGKEKHRQVVDDAHFLQDKPDGCDLRQIKGRGAGGADPGEAEKIFAAVEQCGCRHCGEASKETAGEGEKVGGEQQA